MRLRLIALMSATALTAVGPAHGQTIGTFGSLEPQIDGTPPGAATRRLAVGSNVVADERIVSSANGRGQILFVDQTTITIAPDSDLVLNRFVFDPDRGTGDIAVTLGKGALRFIGGKITKGSEGTIRTPSATIGVRGGLILVDLLGDVERAILVAGEYVCIDGGAGRHCTSRSGGIVTRDGYQGVISEEDLRRLLQIIDGDSDPDPEEDLFRAGADDVGPSDRRKVSTLGEELEDDVLEDDIREDILDGRPIGRDGMGVPPGNVTPGGGAQTPGGGQSPPGGGEFSLIGVPLDSDVIGDDWDRL